MQSTTKKEVVNLTKPIEYKPMWEIKQSATPDTLDLFIYGDVYGGTEYDYDRMCYVAAENSANHFREELGNHPNVKQIHIYINSYGGSVFEGTAIYNQLRRHPAEKIVHIDGFACSVASVIAMVGKVIMPKNAMMLIHNMWQMVIGNAKELRKAADDLDVIMTGNRQAYLQKAGDKITEEKLVEMLDAETWLTAEQCMELGFADEYAEQDADMSQASAVLQKVNLSLTQRIQINQSLAAQLREFTQPTIPKQETETIAPAPAVPAQDIKKLKLFAALSER